MNEATKKIIRYRLDFLKEELDRTNNFITQTEERLNTLYEDRDKLKKEIKDLEEDLSN